MVGNAGNAPRHTEDSAKRGADVVETSEENSACRSSKRMLWPEVGGAMLLAEIGQK